MIITELGFAMMNDARDSLLTRLRRWVRFGRSGSVATQYALDGGGVAGWLPGPDGEEPDGVGPAAGLPPNGPPTIDGVGGVRTGPGLTSDERRARAMALRGLSQSRGGKFEAARESFVFAAEMDAAIDLSKLPEFWRLPQEAHQMAIEAYEQVGRLRDAAALTATVRTKFRPKPMRGRGSIEPLMPEV